MRLHRSGELLGSLPPLLLALLLATLAVTFARGLPWLVATIAQDVARAGNATTAPDPR